MSKLKQFLELKWKVNNMEENIELIKLQAEAYRLIVGIEQLQIRLQQVNKMIIESTKIKEVQNASNI